MNKVKLTLLTTLFFTSTHSWETDNFTYRRQILKADDDEKMQNLTALNDETNRRIHKAVNRFNNKFRSDCTEDLTLLNGKEKTAWGTTKLPKLYMNIKDALGGTIFGAMETWSEKSDQITRYGEGDYIYGDDLIGNFYNLQTAFNINGHVVGPDKLGHFIDQGFELYQEFKTYEDPAKGFKKAMKHSDEMEEDYYGLGASGVKSYGDMGANFSGMKFWYNLTGTEDSFIKCNPKSGKYEILRDFDWAIFADGSWDQGINCSMFKSTKNPFKHGQYPNEKYLYATDKDKGLKDYLSKIDKTIKCPDDLKKCREISKLECSNYFVSPKCLMAANAKLSCSSSNYDKVMKLNKGSGYEYNRNAEKNNSNIFGRRTLGL